MLCRDFHRQYSEYRDGHDPVLAAEMDDHLEGCLDCASFDRVLRQGVHTLQTGQPTLSDDFLDRLNHRLASGEPVPEPHPPRVSSLAATAAAVFFVTLIVLTLRELTVLPPPVAAESPMVVTEARAIAGIPFVVFEPLKPVKPTQP